MNIRQVVRGDYVATPIKNAFNNKTSYWFSKRNCTVSLYMFTVGNGDTEQEFEERLSQKGFDEIIPRFEEYLKRPFNSDVYLEERKNLEAPWYIWVECLEDHGRKIGSCTSIPYKHKESAEQVAESFYGDKEKYKYIVSQTNPWANFSVNCKSNEAISEEMVQEAMDLGWSEEDAKRGYGVFSSPDVGNGATHIERIDEMDVFESDDDAAIQAEKDGFKIIRDINFPMQAHANYLDTPENRELLKEFSSGGESEEKKKYCVTVTRTGCLFIEASSEAEAMDIADHQTTETVNWSEDWTPTDCCEDDSETGYITEKAFE